MECVDCRDTGVIGADNTIVNGGDFCNCKVGEELQEEMLGCGNCPNIDTEATCEEDCPILPIEIDKCNHCGKYYEGIYGRGCCQKCQVRIDLAKLSGITRAQMTVELADEEDDIPF